jgi:hypothetical protein
MTAGTASVGVLGGGTEIEPPGIVGVFGRYLGEAKVLPALKVFAARRNWEAMSFADFFVLGRASCDGGGPGG